VARLRIRTRTLTRGLRPKGQDTIEDDGSVRPLDNVRSLAVYVGSRSEYVTAVLVIHGVELDVEVEALCQEHEDCRANPVIAAGCLAANVGRRRQ